MDNIPEDDAFSSFQPSLIVVIAVLGTVLIITFLLLIYAKFFYRSSLVVNNVRIISNGGQLTRSNLSGIDKTVIEALPFFRFSSLKGTREGLECAVCLSKFEDIEILRLLPKCKHAFHINCVDQWLEYHSTCPLCRHKISLDDVIFFTNSSSLRLLRTHSELTQESNLELFIEREEENDIGSSRFSCGGSFSRRYDKLKKEDETIQASSTNIGNDSINDTDEEILHKLNHKIIISDVVLKHRWSNVSSSDLITLNSNMLNEISSNRFSSTADTGKNVDLEKSKLSRKISMITQSDRIPFSTSSKSSHITNNSEKRSISEITIHPRFEQVIDEERRNVWLPIAQRTAETKDSQDETRDSSNV